MENIILEHNNIFQNWGHVLTPKFEDLLDANDGVWPGNFGSNTRDGLNRKNKARMLYFHVDAESW